MNGALGFGLLSALIWGAADFCGGLATRRCAPVLCCAGGGNLRRRPVAAGGIGVASATAPPGGLGLERRRRPRRRHGLAGFVHGPQQWTHGHCCPDLCCYCRNRPYCRRCHAGGSARCSHSLPVSPLRWRRFGCSPVAGRAFRLGSRTAPCPHWQASASVFYFVLIDRADPASSFWNLTFARSFAAIVLLALVLAIRHPLLPPAMSCRSIC